MSNSQSITDLANAIRARNEAGLKEWGLEKLRQKNSTLLKIKRSRAGKSLIDERESLDAEYEHNIKPMEDRWAKLNGLHIKGGVVINDGSELRDHEYVKNDYWIRCERWQERWNALLETYDRSKLSTAKPDPGNTTGAIQPDRAALAATLAVKHPDWSANKLAKEVGCHPSTLSRSPLFQKAKSLAQSKPDRHKGWKNKDGTIEAVADEN